MQTGDFYLDPNLILPARSPSPEITYPYPLFKQEDDLKRAAMKPNQVRNVSLLILGRKCIGLYSGTVICRSAL